MLPCATMWLLTLLACAPKAPVAPLAAVPADLGAHDVVRVAVIGQIDDGPASRGVLADVVGACAELSLVVVLDPGHDWTPPAGCGAPILPVVGPRTLHRDRQLRRLRGKVDVAEAYRAIDVRGGDVPWRLVALELGRDERDPAYAEQRYWLPRAVDAPRVVVLAAQPSSTLTRLRDPDDEARRLLAATRDLTPPGALVAVVQGGTRSNELHLPDGPWGPAWIVAGTSGTPSEDLLQSRPDRTLALAGAWVRALRVVGDPVDVEGIAVYRGDTVPMVGWWELALGERAEVVFHRWTGAQTRSALRLTAGEAGWAADVP